MSDETEKLINDAMDEMQRFGIDNLRAKGAIILLSEALRRAETARDAAIKQSAGWEIQAQDLRDRLVRAEAERDAQHAQVLRLTGERDAARVQLRAANDFLRVVTLERDHAQQVEVPDAFWQRDEARPRKVEELTAIRVALTKAGIPESRDGQKR